MLYVSIDLIVSFLEAFCCQMFFDVFANENQERKGKIFKTVAIVILGLLYFGLGRILSSLFLVKEVIVITVTAMVMVLLRDFGIKKAPILAFLFQGILVAMEYLAYVFIQMIVSDETNVSDTEGVLSTFIAIVDMLLVFLCVVLVRRLFKGHKNKMLYDEEWLKFIVFPIFTIISIGAFISSFRSLDNPNQLRMLYIVSLGLILMNIFVFYLLEDIVRKGEVAKEKEMFELQGKDQLEMYNALSNISSHRPGCLSVKNTFCQPVIRQGDDFLTSKDYERSSHGVGIRNVIKVVNKYGGTYVINDSNKEFYFSIMLPM